MQMSSPVRYELGGHIASNGVLVIDEIEAGGDVDIRARTHEARKYNG